MASTPSLACRRRIYRHPAIRRSCRPARRCWAGGAVPRSTFIQGQCRAIPLLDGRDHLQLSTQSRRVMSFFPAPAIILKGGRRVVTQNPRGLLPPATIRPQAWPLEISRPHRRRPNQADVFSCFFRLSLPPPPPPSPSSPPTFLHPILFPFSLPPLFFCHFFPPPLSSPLFPHSHSNRGGFIFIWRALKGFQPIPLEDARTKPDIKQPLWLDNLMTDQKCWRKRNSAAQWASIFSR